MLDTSKSMDRWVVQLTGLIDVANAVGEALLGQVCDYHMGLVTTADMPQDNEEPCNTSGDMIRGGKLGPCDYRNGLGYVTAESDVAEAFGCMLVQTFSGSAEERQAQRVLDAFTQTKLDPGGCNEGFLRPSAPLILLYVSDEDDASSSEGPYQWYSIALSRAAPGDLFGVFIVGTGETAGYDWDPDAGADGQGIMQATEFLQYADLFPDDHVFVHDLAAFVDAPDDTAALVEGIETIFQRAIDGCAPPDE